jgi:hypothetical protein
MRSDSCETNNCKKVDNLPAEDKSALLRFVGGFLGDVKTKQAYSS